jgi:hypothetical protein
MVCGNLLKINWFSEYLRDPQVNRSQYNPKFSYANKPEFNINTLSSFSNVTYKWIDMASPLCVHFMNLEICKTNA